MVINSSSLSSTEALLSCRVNEKSITAKMNQFFNITLSIVDQISLIPVQNISWKVAVNFLKKLYSYCIFNEFLIKSFNWSASIQLQSFTKCSPKGYLSSQNSIVNFDSSSGLATFINIYFTYPGSYILSFNVKSSNGQYDFKCSSSKVLVTSSTLLTPETPSNVIISFDADYKQKLNQIENYKAMFYNCFINKFNLSLYTDIYDYAGSVVFETNLAENSKSSAINALVAELNLKSSACLDDVFCPKYVNIFGKTYNFSTITDNSLTNSYAVANSDITNRENQNAVILSFIQSSKFNQKL